MAAALHQLHRMLVFRSLTVGLLGACLYLLGNVAQLPRELPVAVPPLQVASFTGSTPNRVSVIDVAPGLPATTVASLIRLDAGEQIAMVGELPVGGDVAAGIEIASVLRRGDKLLDLTVTGETGGRRVLVILH